MFFQRVGCAVIVHGERVIERHVHRHFRLHRLGGPALAGYRPAHRREVAEQWDARHAVEHHAPDDERYLGRARRVRLPAREIEHVLLVHRPAVAVPEQRFEDDADGYRQAGDAAGAARFEFLRE
jgi:hypothetical protein